jgi:O-antigen ligase
LFIVSSSKLLLFFILFNIINVLIQQSEDFLPLLIKAIVLAFLLSLLSFIKQINFIEGFTYESIFGYSGISGHKNLYSSFVFLTLIGSFVGLGLFKRQKLWPILIYFTITLQILIIFILRSRAVWLAITVSLVIFIILSIFKKNIERSSKIWLYSFLTSCFATLFIVIVLPIILNWYLSVHPQSENISRISDLSTISERIKVWGKTYDLINENTFFGVGSGNWKINISKYSLPEIYKVQDLNVIFQRPHNEYLKIFSENGVFGLFAFLFLVCYISLSLLKTNNHLSRGNTKYLLSGLIGFCVIMFFSFPLERIEHSLILTFLLSIAYSSVNTPIKKSSPNQSKILISLSLLACLAITFVFKSRYRSSYYLKNMYYERAKGNNEKVVSICDLAITPLTKVDDYSIPIHWYRGNANANMNNFSAALQDMKYSLQYHPYNAHVLNDLGSAYAMNNMVDSAIYFYVSSSKINPRFDDPKLNLVAIYINKGNLEEAKKWEERILHDSDRRSYYNELIIQMEYNNKLAK